jgi:hypothetical protein
MYSTVAGSGRSTRRRRTGGISLTEHDLADSEADLAESEPSQAVGQKVCRYYSKSNPEYAF